MCLIFLAHNTHPDYALIVAANRDEFYARPTEAANFWADWPQILAGRDREQNGAWLGLARAGRFACVTNYRDPAHIRSDARSRGWLVRDYLAGRDAPETFLRRVAGDDAAYNGYNLLTCNLHRTAHNGLRSECVYHSNVSGELRRLDAGLYGLSNHFLDTPWPKLQSGKAEFQKILERDDLSRPDALFALMADTRLAPDAELPDTGIGLERERFLSARFLRSPVYGTRATSVVLIDRAGHARFYERTFRENGTPGGEQAHKFVIEFPEPAAG